MSQKTLKYILLIASIAAFAFSFRLLLKDQWSAIYAEYFPCQKPITYGMISFDSRFDISKEEFLEALEEAEAIWEGPSGKDLFAYEADVTARVDVSVNLVYDYRQEATEKIHALGLIVSDTRHSYDALREKYDTLQTTYSREKRRYDTRSAAFVERENEYTEKVNYWNSQNGAPEKEYRELTEEAEYLREELAEIQVIEKSLNEKINNINALVVVINRLARTLNLNASEINKAGESQGEEFTQGEYRSGYDGEEINVYEFSTKSKLVRLLAHEFGHALGIEHVEDPQAIMYRMNESKNNLPTAADLDALKVKCRIKD